MKKRNSVEKFVIGVFACLLLVLTSGCASTNTPKYSGFLDDYSGLKESSRIKGVMVEHNPYKNMGDYSKFMIDPVVIFFRPNKHQFEINPRKIGLNSKRLAMLTDHLESEVKRALEERNLMVVQRPGEGVLRIRFALTNVDANLPILNIHSYTSATGLGLGGASAEVEGVDSITNERIIAAYDSRRGSNIPAIKGKSVVEIGMDAADNKLKSLTMLGTIEKILTNWAEQFADEVEYQRNLSKS